MLYLCHHHHHENEILHSPFVFIHGQVQHMSSMQLNGHLNLNFIGATTKYGRKNDKVLKYHRHIV